MWLIELLKYLGEQLLLDKVSPIFFVWQYQKGVLVRRGRFLRNLEPGTWNYKIPVIDRFVTCVAVPDTILLSNVNVTTLDGVTCTVSCCFEYQVDDPYRFLLEANDAVSNIRDIGMGCIAHNLIDLNWEDINRRKTINDIRRTLNKDLEQYGVTVPRFWFTDVVKTRVLTLVNQ